MLRNLRISHFAIIDELEIDLGKGMTALTGETGAGKSILLDALGLVLGDRADAGSIREGAQRAEISASFDISQLNEASVWLQDNELNDESGECILRRTISQDGRSKAYINNTPVTLQTIRQFGQNLVDIHGQHEHQSLLKRETQQQRLDAYGHHEPQLEKLSNLYKQWRTSHDELFKIRADERDRSERLDMLRYQAQEFEQLQLIDNEWEKLQEEHQRLANANKLIEGSHQAFNMLYENEELAVHSVLSRQHTQLEQLCELDPALSDAVNAINTALIHTDEAADQLRTYMDNLSADPARLHWVDERIGALHDLARKHHCEPGQLIDVANAVQQELHDLEHSDERLQALEKQYAQLSNDYLEQAKKLTQLRLKAGKRLSKAVTEAMQTLGMAGGRFAVSITAKTVDPASGDGFAAKGLDTIELEVSANPGQTLRPLSKVASGGELARISLAIQMITASNETIPTLIFDEVDSGIGGGIAEIVGSHLRSLGEQRQVMCVTHLPQVAAQAHCHLSVSKTKQTTKTGHTHATIRRLNDEERITEVARMLGGVEITKTTQSHAQEMIAKAAATTAEPA